jgi:predicted RNase H-like nuclease (RuvC/YqgF family)
MLEVENEELELKNKKLETENIDLGDKLEEMYEEIRHLEQNNSQDEMECVSAKFKNEIRGLEKKLEQNQKMLKDATDTVDILESTLNKKSIEIDPWGMPCSKSIFLDK